MKTILALVTAFLLIGCAGSSGGGSGAAASATVYDFSGNYTLSRIQCYNSALTVPSTYAVLQAASSNTELISIVNGVLTTITTLSVCQTTTTGNITFTDAGMTVTNRVVTNKVGGGCATGYVRDTTPANTITPGSITAVYTLGQTLPDIVNAAYIRNTTTSVTAILSTFANSSSVTDLCFVVYNKN